MPAKIGPQLYPYKSLSTHAREHGLDINPVYGSSNLIFYSAEPNPSKVPCPVAAKEHNDHVCGNSIKCAIIHHLIECEDGRFKGDISLGDAHKHYDFACQAHLPKSERTPLRPHDPLTQHHTTALEAATCFYCCFPSKIDPNYDPKSDTPTTKPTEPVVIG